MNTQKIALDIRRLSIDIERRWNKNLAPWGIAGAGQRIATTVDMAALTRCIDFILNEPPSDGVRGYRTALRLAAILQLIERHQIAIERHLRAA